ncbi:MAG: hypothetical protein K6E46_01950 [Lachnospiraceae bacterium]|nr:hypothetical protein [Lachnospiraceae bacterium]
MIEYKPFLDDMLTGYANSYDVERINEYNEDSPLVAKAHFHVVESQCLIFKEFSMWTAEADEYVFTYYVKKLTEDKARELIKKTYEEGFTLINLEDKNLKKQHMCTRIVAVIITDGATDEALKVIKRCRIYKNFKFSLKGWMEMHVASVDLTKAKVTGNPYSKDTVKFLKTLISHRQKCENI